MIDSDSDLISLNSASSLFSVDSEDKQKERSIRQRVMVKLLDDLDTRNKDCAYRQMDKDLENGVGKNILEISKSSEDEDSSELIDSARVDAQIADKADPAAIAPDVIGAPEPTPPSSEDHSGESEVLSGAEGEESEQEDEEFSELSLIHI